MIVKSNIAVSSNIYIKSANLENDVDFVRNVTGYKALEKLERKLSGTLVKAKLNNIQRMEVQQARPCSKAKNKELTHGKVVEDGQVKWRGRCEYSQCDAYSVCPETRAGSGIIRTIEPDKTSEMEEIDFDIEEYTYLGLNLRDDALKEAMLDDQEIYEDLKEEYKLENKEEIIEAEVEIPITGFREIKQPDEIVSSDINSKVFVNAGPGERVIIVTGCINALVSRVSETFIKNNSCIA